MENSIAKKLPNIPIEAVVLVLAVTIALTVVLVRQMQKDLWALENNVYNNRVTVKPRPCGCKDVITDVGNIATASAEMEVDNGRTTTGNEHSGNTTSDI